MHACSQLTRLSQILLEMSCKYCNNLFVTFVYFSSDCIIIINILRLAVRVGIFL